MDFATFKEKLFNDELKSIPTPQNLQDCLKQKYPEVEIMGAYKLDASYNAVYFKHKLWEKLATFKGEEWIETRVMSLKNQLPDSTNELLIRNLKKAIHIVRLESVIPVDGEFYFYVIAKIAGKKFVLHISREGEVMLKSKFMDYRIRIGKNDDDDDDDMDDEEDEIEEVPELVVEEEDMD